MHARRVHVCACSQPATALPYREGLSHVLVPAWPSNGRKEPVVDVLCEPSFIECGVLLSAVGHFINFV